MNKKKIKMKYFESCVRKQKYITHEQASAVMYRMQNSMFLNVYKCECCHKFHIGHKQKFQR